MDVAEIAREDFDCAVCQRTIVMRWNRKGRDQVLPPVCLYCERSFAERIGKPTQGSFRDRRMVMRGFAVAEALHCEAMRKKWSTTHVSA